MLSLKYLERTLCKSAPSLKSPSESLRLKCLEELEDAAESQYDPDDPDPVRKYKKTIEIHRQS
jgi:hypothetical protein